MSDLPTPLVAGVDVGGTFTDAVVIGGHGRPVMRKSATTPADQSRGLADAVAGATAGRPLGALAHGTTTATNAVLERSFDPPALLVTAGFSDLLVIARQDRPSLYDLEAVRPDPVVPPSHVVGVAERIGAGGVVLTPLEDAEVMRVVEAVRDLGVRAVAIVLLFGWAEDRHERLLADALARALPDLHLTVSADLVGAVREYERASTCALNAAVGPLMAGYLSRLTARVPDADVTVMTSGGGTARITDMIAEPVHTLLSGPAAGVVAAAATAQQAGFAEAVAFDMGGTSTDVCLITDGQPVIDQRGQIDGLPIGTPTVGIHTVGAGGGSIAWIDPGGALQVGPRSAGAEPGPACYGRGGVLPTVTDAHAVLGHLSTLAGGAIGVDVPAAQRALDTLPDVDATGVLAVVRAQMARALRTVTTDAGIDPAGLALVAFGGAGPLHASALGRMLGCAAAVLPPAPGVLSAAGLLVAPRRQEVSQSVIGMARAELPGALASLAARLSPALTDVEVVADVRYAGQAHELRIGLGQLDPDQPPHIDEAQVAVAFHRAHTASYGYAMDDTTVQIVTVRLVATGPALHPTALSGWDLGEATPPRRIVADLGHGPQQIAVHARATLRTPGTVLEGPALITQPDSTGLLLEGDVATVDDHDNLVIRWDDRPRPGARGPLAPPGGEADG